MNALYILGAGGFGREVLTWARQHTNVNREWRIAGFIDDNLNALDKYAVGEQVVARIDDYQPGANDWLVCALGQPKIKAKCIAKLKARGARFLTFIHPSAVVGERVGLGEGVVICPGSIVTCDAVLGDFVTLNLNCCVGHDATIGRFSQLSSFCDITGWAKIGEGVLLGSHASVLPRQVVGDWATVGAGSVVAGTVGAGQTVFGVPARPLEL